tara:strand:+ start:501 stop:809 length:309 start_codon:yes stop_codon:yes gene_type:complete
MKIIKSFENFVKSINEERETKINEIADWDTRKIIKDKETISCDGNKEYERIPMKNSIKKIFPGIFTDEAIDKAIEHCCNEREQSRQREDFYKCVYNRLMETL